MSTMIDNDVINHWCDTLEDHWEWDFTNPIPGIERLRRFWKQIPEDLKRQTTLKKALVETDLCKSWMNWMKFLDRAGGDFRAEEWRCMFERLPQLRDYAAVLNFQLEDIPIWRDLARCEYSFRQRWGDAISKEFYAEQFGMEVGNTSCKSRSVACYLEHPSDPIRSQPFPLSGLTEIGRQCSTDPFALGQHFRGSQNRIVIATYTETAISRKQLTLQLLSPKFGLLRNLGKGGRNTTTGNLAAGSTCLVSFPFSVSLSGRNLVFE